jgi:RimK family alpha-L-glutamate ligase
MEIKMIWYLTKNNKSDYELNRIFEEAALRDLEIKHVEVDNFDLIVTRNDRRSIILNNETVKLPSVVIPRTGSGTSYYAMSVLRHLERMHVPVLNTSDSIDAAQDKMYSTQILAQHNIPVPKTMLVRFPVDASLVEKQIGFPCVIKILSGSYGNGVHLVQDAKSLKELMEFVSSLNSPLNILIQEYVSEHPGTDVRVLVIGGKIVGAMKRSSTDGDFRANISRGGTGSVFEVDEELSYLSLNSAKVLNLEIAGVDVLIDKDGYKVCEVNSAPGFEGFEKFCDKNVAKEFIQYSTFRQTT